MALFNILENGLLLFRFTGFLMIDCCFDEAAEERMRTIRTGLEFRMSLGRKEERMILQFDHFDNTVIRRETDRN